MSAETRNAAFGWAALPILITLIWTNWRKFFLAYVGIGIGITLTVLYPLYTNWTAYHEINITKVDDFYAMEFFNGVTLTILPPFTFGYPTAQEQMWFEYWSEWYPNRTPAERKAISQKYWKKAWDIIKQDPLDYIRWRFFKMWYVWQKENIFFYSEPNYAAHKIYTYYLNLTLLILGIVGLIGFWINKIWRVKNKSSIWVWGSFLATILYGTIAFCFSHAEYRLTIPFYPIVLSLAAMGIVTTIEMVKPVVRRFKLFK
jgi:hypothetical protein